MHEDFNDDMRIFNVTKKSDRKYVMQSKVECLEYLYRKSLKLSRKSEIMKQAMKYNDLDY